MPGYTPRASGLDSLHDVPPQQQLHGHTTHILYNTAKPCDTSVLNTFLHHYMVYETVHVNRTGPVNASTVLPQKRKAHHAGPSSHWFHELLTGLGSCPLEDGSTPQHCSCHGLLVVICVKGCQQNGQGCVYHMLHLLTRLTCIATTRSA